MIKFSFAIFASCELTLLSYSLDIKVVNENLTCVMVGEYYFIRYDSNCSKANENVKKKLCRYSNILLKVFLLRKQNTLLNYINWGFHRVSNCKICAININLNGSEGETEKMRSSSPKRYNLAGNRAIFSQTHWEKQTNI